MNLANLAIGLLGLAPGGGFVLEERSAERLEAALDIFGKAPEVARWSSIEALLRLATALEEKLESPTAAARIRRAVLRAEWTLPLLSQHATAEHRRRGERQFAAFSGTPERRHAPGIDAHAPHGSIPIRTLIDPFAQERRRAAAQSGLRRDSARSSSRAR